MNSKFSENVSSEETDSDEEKILDVIK